MKLSELREGESGVVVEVRGDSEVRRKLLDMGIVKGAEIKMVRNAPLKDPVEFELKGYYLSLRRKEAENVIVE
ncbi:ferrous iron transport protein A [Archaeoglobales archaeon]|nr:MAG: ferrous iron transport protein A [Archaeoglobales archaeon]